MIEGTVTATLLNRLHRAPSSSAARPQASLYTVNEFAHEIAKMVTADVETGHVELVGERAASSTKDSRRGGTQRGVPPRTSSPAPPITGWCGE